MEVILGVVIGFPAIVALLCWLPDEPEFDGEEGYDDYA